MTKSRSQSFKSVKSIKSTKSTKSQTHSTSSFKNAFNDIKTKGFAGIPTRFVVVLVAAISNTLSYTIRTNMSVTIVAMVNGTGLREINDNNSYTTPNPSDTCPYDDSEGSSEDSFGDFTWSESMQGHILGSFYYGYIATNINGGQLADMFGVRYLCGFVTLISAVLTFLTPVISHWSPIALIILRVITGLAQGILTPAIYALLAQWIPRSERAVVLALIQVGGNFGAVVAMPLSGYLCKNGFAGGWPSVFYVIGICGVLCFILWMYCIYDCPAKHPRISDTELNLISDNVNVSFINAEKARKKIIPWKLIALSLPMWAIAVAKFCGAWGNLMLMSKLPTYLESVLHMSIEMNGIITAIVYVALSVSLTSFGFISDWVGQKRLIGDTLSRKIFETIALGGPAICLALIPIVGCNLTHVIVLLVIAMIIFGLNAGGDKPVVVDIAPDHSGTIYGITNAIASLPGILAPLYVGYFLDGKYGSLKQWNIVFYSSAGFYIFGLVFFIIFGTAKAQTWGIIEGRSRGTTLASSYRGGRSRGATFASSYKNVSAPTTPRSVLKGVYNKDNTNNAINGLVFTISFADSDQQNEPQILESDEGIEEEFDENEEDFDNFQYFKERRFSIFPIP